MRFWIVFSALAGCAAPSGDYRVAVHVNADAWVCVDDYCGDALVWEPFRLVLAEGEYPVTADARGPLGHQEFLLEVGVWGPNRAWVDFASGEFHFAKIEFVSTELVTIRANEVAIGISFQGHPLVYGFAPRRYTFCAETLDETKSDCAEVDLADGAELIIFFTLR